MRCHGLYGYRGRRVDRCGACRGRCLDARGWDRAHIAAVRPPEPTLITPTASQIATAQMTRTTSGGTTPAVGMPAAAPPHATTSATVPATPARANWIEVGRWAGNEMIITAPFTVHGPWRLCWTLPTVGIGDARQIMIGDAAETNWDIETGPTGASAGSFDLKDGGSFRLMFHNDTPYVALAIEPPPGIPADDLAPPPCGK
jgi:hypothetical protein